MGRHGGGGGGGSGGGEEFNLTYANRIHLPLSYHLGNNVWTLPRRLLVTLVPH